MNYYSLYNKSKVNEVIMHINVLLQKWLKSKYRERSTKKVVEMYKNLIQSNSRLFYHWTKGITNAFNY
jgi:hypothetical protein